MKLITELEAKLIEETLKDVEDILNEEGYEYEARDVALIITIMARLQNKTAEEALDDDEDSAA